MLPVDEAADDVGVRVVCLGNNDITRSEVGMTDTETAEGWVLGDQGRRNSGKEVQVVDMIRWKLLLVLVNVPPCTVKRQQRSTKLL